MTTYQISSSLLKNAVRTNTIIALNNSSAPAPEWLVQATIILCSVAILSAIAFTVWSYKDDIEYYFWSKKYHKN